MPSPDCRRFHNLFADFLFVICSLKREEEERLALKIKSGRMRAAQ